MSFLDEYWKPIVETLLREESLNLIRIIEVKKGWDLTDLKLKYENKEMKKSIKENIIYCFKMLIHKANADDEKGASFKTREYTDTIKAISEYDGKINNINDVESVLKNFGKKNPTKTLEKIQEIIDTGTHRLVEEAKKDGKVLSVCNLTKVYSIGIKKALELYNNYNIITIEDLQKQILKTPDILHNKQKIGLKYYDDLNERIPKKEMNDYNNVLKNIVETLNLDINFSINGSYRRNMPSSGDIDVLISSHNKDARKRFIETLKKESIIKETLADGSKKFMGISKLKGYNKYRHIDIIECNPNEYAFAQLYFTGSGGFNAKMRGIALEKGYSMNEYCLSNKLTKKSVSEEEILKKIGKNCFETELDIFQFLDIEYVSPENRITDTPSKIF